MNEPPVDRAAALGDPDDLRTRRIAELISGLLRWGVRGSLALIVVGTMLTFFRDPTIGTADVSRLTGGQGEFPRDWGWFLGALTSGVGVAWVVLGLLLLIVTPVLRVVLSMVAFVQEKERVYLLVTAAVLGLLVLSFLLGRVSGRARDKMDKPSSGSSDVKDNYPPADMNRTDVAGFFTARGLRAMAYGESNGIRSTPRLLS